MYKFKQFLLHWFIPVHVCLASTFILFKTYGDQTPSFFQTYGGVLFTQGWYVFSPDPEKENIQLQYQCHPQDELRTYPIYLNWIERQMGSGYKKLMFHEVLVLYQAKLGRKLYGNFRPKDAKVMAEAKSHILRELSKKCHQTKTEEIEFEIKAVPFLE